MQRDHRRAARARRRHLVQSRHLAELALERRRDRRGHHIGAGARIERDDLDRRIIDLRQRRERQHPIRDDAGQQNRDHQQRSRHRPQDELSRRIHRGSRRFACGRGYGLSRRPCFAAAARHPVRARHRNLWRAARLRAAPAAPGACASRVTSSTLAPSRSLSAPSTTTRSPGATPLSIAVDFTLRGSELDRPDADRAIGVDDEDEGPRRAALDRGRRDQRRVRPCFDAHPHIDELVREERAVGVRKFGLELDGAGRRVDLVVDRDELAGRELHLAVAVEGLDGDRFTGCEALHHPRHTVLGQREHDGDRHATA